MNLPERKSLRVGRLALAVIAVAVPACSEYDALEAMGGPPTGVVTDGGGEPATDATGPDASADAAGEAIADGGVAPSADGGVETGADSGAETGAETGAAADAGGDAVDAPLMQADADAGGDALADAAGQ
jgi:hypothetical protein